jgi:hypothetical protein
LKLDGLQGVISQKMILFITTGVKTSNPTKESFIPVTKRKELIVEQVNKINKYLW